MPRITVVGALGLEAQGNMRATRERITVGLITLGPSWPMRARRRAYRMSAADGAGLSPYRITSAVLG